MVECSDRSIYTGITTDIDRRLHEHQNTQKGSKYVRRRLPIKLRWSSEWMDKSQALKEEYRIKRLTAKEKRKMWG